MVKIKYDLDLIPSNFRFPEADNRLLDALKNYKIKKNLIYDKDYQDFLFAKGRASPNKKKAKILQYDSKFNNIVNPHERIKDKYYIKKYPDKYKLIYMPSVRASGVEDNRLDEVSPQSFLKDLGYKYSTKLENSLIRAKKTIYDLAYCNEWEYFFTGTVSSDNINRSDLKVFHKKFTQMIKNLNFQKNLDIKFLIIPEKHKSGDWHFHGFLMGLPVEYLTEYIRSDYWSIENQDLPKLPYAILNELENGNRVWKWDKFESKFGWCTLTKIRDKEAVSCYCLKYITKDLLKSVSEVGAHTYYRSRGLRLPETTKEGKMDEVLLDSILWDVENDFCKIRWLDEKEVKFFLDDNL